MISIINRQLVFDVFKAYTDEYDSKNPKIKLKIDHTYRVAAISERIAKSLKLSKEDTDLSWLIGMLHDIGRFEQVKRYKTFIDAKSISHALLGANILFANNLIERFLVPAEYYDVIEKSIRLHSEYRLPDNLSERELMFVNILRDADKIDIFRVNVETDPEVIYGTTVSEVKQSFVCSEVKSAAFEGHAILRSLKKTPADNLIGHISLVFELVYRESLIITREQGYLDTMLNFESENPDTVLFLNELKKLVNKL